MALLVLWVSAVVDASKKSKRGDGVDGAPEDGPTLAPTPKIYTYAPSPTELFASSAPTGSQTITHNPDWTEAQLISVIIGSVVGITAVVLAVYCAYARGAFAEGPKISKGPVEVVDGSREEFSPIFRTTDKP